MKKIVEPVDAEDNGVGIVSPMIDEIYPYSYWNVISSLNPTWKERDKNLDELFGKAVALSREILLREIERARHFVEGRTFVEQAYDSAEDKRLIILDAEYSWSDILINKDEPIFVVGPNLEEKQWRVLAVRIDAHSFKIGKICRKVGEGSMTRNWRWKRVFPMRLLPQQSFYRRRSLKRRGDKVG